MTDDKAKVPTSTRQQIGVFVMMNYVMNRVGTKLGLVHEDDPASQQAVLTKTLKLARKE